MSPQTNSSYDTRILIVLMLVLSVFVMSIRPSKEIARDALQGDCRRFDGTVNRLIDIDCENPDGEIRHLNRHGRGDTGGDVSKVVFAFQPVPVNHASTLLLQTIKGVGPRLAQAIIDHREHYGAFANADALKRLPGVGEKKSQYLATQFTFD